MLVGVGFFPGVFRTPLGFQVPTCPPLELACSCTHRVLGRLRARPCALKWNAAPFCVVAASASLSARSVVGGAARRRGPIATARPVPGRNARPGGPRIIVARRMWWSELACGGPHGRSYQAGPRDPVPSCSRAPVAGRAPSPSSSPSSAPCDPRDPVTPAPSCSRAPVQAPSSCAPSALRVVGPCWKLR
jgi:hypothetical protein